MFYIPTDWLKDKTNESKVHEILNKNITSDINIDVSLACKELNDIGETIIIEKINDGEITVD